MDIKQSKKQLGSHRDSSLEVLRIIAMILIVLHHLSVHGGFYFDTTYLHLPEIWLNIIAIGGTIGNNIFVLISGYFLIKSDFSGGKFVKKLLKLVLEVSFYSFMLYIICVGFITGFSNISLKGIIDSITPFNNYRFFDAYILLYLLVPFLNKGLLQLSASKHCILIILLMLMNIVMLNFLYSERSNLFWFITVYVISSYIRLYGSKMPIKSCIFYSIFSSFIAVSIVLLKRLSITGFEAVTTVHQYKNYNIFLFASALFLFLAFTKIKIKNNKNINMLASAAFGVYLIHESPLISGFLWTIIFNVSGYQSSILLIPYSILVTIFVYLICSVIDIIRQIVIETPLLNLTEKWRNSLDVRFSKTVTKSFPDSQKT